MHKFLLADAIELLIKVLAPPFQRYSNPWPLQYGNGAAVYEMIGAREQVNFTSPFIYATKMCSKLTVFAVSVRQYIAVVSNNRVMRKISRFNGIQIRHLCDTSAAFAPPGFLIYLIANGRSSIFYNGAINSTFMFTTQ